jgi:hypothetical protein
MCKTLFCVAEKLKRHPEVARVESATLTGFVQNTEANQGLPPAA